MGWQPGDEILWCYRRQIVPARVVADDECLVVWIPSGTTMLSSVPVDGRDLRDRPCEERFTCERVFALQEWFGAGSLRISYPGDAHSSWLFRHGDHETFWGWYGNLEDPLRRDERGVHTRDHVLDVWLDAEGRVGWKDEDELEATVTVGHFSAEQANSIRAYGEKVFAAMEQRVAPYDGSWLDWRPDPSWPVPTLPEEFMALAGTPSYELFPSREEN
jgi:hypothetical protein